jgi:flagellar protein FliJ
MSYVREREGNMLLRRKRFEMTEKARQVALLETMISDFERLAAGLSQQILAEEERTKIRDREHFTYSTFAKAAALRRANLLTSAAELKAKLDAAKHELDEVTEQLRDLELTHSDTPSSIDVAA